MDYQVLRARGVAYRDKKFPASQNNYLVGIAWHFIKDATTVRSNSDLMWIETRGTKTVAKIRSAYLQQARASGHSLPLDIGLTVQNQPLRDDVSVSQLNFFKDRVIILQAHDTAGHSHLHDDFEDDLFDTKLAAASYYSDEDERPTADESESDDEDVRDVEEPGVHQQDQFTMYDRDHDASQSPTSTPFDSTYAAIIAKIADLERIEAIAKQGLGRLRPLEDCLRSSPRSADAPVFLQKITELRQQARYARTIIGVVGVTGSGKSSVLNAVLEEENILPTSGMRACTAVPVELSYNNTEDPSKKYRAVIEFIDSDDWKKELKLCLEAIKDDPRGVSAESESEAGMAYAKIKAVYPNVTKSMLANMTVEALLKQKHVQHHLGANRSITSPSPGPFFAGLQKFIDTVDDSATRKGPKQPEMWPLVKCVKIYLKARALSTGTTLVDLPGAQDSNAAREAVTDQYIRQCSGLWIVAPINRAVNDKTAKALLGEHFKRQMKLDGLLENVTFICTKSDDISIRETQASLDISDQLGEASSEWKRHKAAEEAIWDQIDVVDARIKELDDAYKAIRSEIRTWNALKKQHGQGREVFAPQPKSVKKRAPATKAAQSSPRKRLKQGESSNVRAIPTRNPFLDNDDDDSEEEDDTGRAQPLTEHDIATKIEDLKKQQVEAKEEGSKEYETRTTLDAQIENVQALILASKEKQKVICIAARNNWSRSRIRRDYALEIKELDQECAEKAGGDDFDPNKELRDYDALGASLPVFCVSSRAYQALCGRAKIDGQTAGFQAVDETEIPQLIAHCAKMTEMSRITTNRIFLRDLTDLLLSLSLWASDAGSGGRLSDAQREEQRRLLDRDLEKLKADLGNAITRAMKDLRVTIEKHILKALTRATQQAEFAAGSTADAWGASEDGLHWSTYRAVVKRDGAYTNRKGDTYDFNKDLSALFEKYFASGWEECFHRIIPKHLKSLGMGQGLNLNSFHELIAGRANTLGFGVARIQVLGQRLRIWKDRCAVQGDELIKTISDMQKGISRDIVPVIKKRMCPSYRANAHLKGKGSPAILRELIEQAVRDNAKSMFGTCSRGLRAQLRELQDAISKAMKDFVESIVEELDRDYRNALFGLEIDYRGESEEEQEMRNNLRQVVHEMNNLFISLASADTITVPEDIEIIEEEKMDIKNQATLSEEDAADVVAEVWIQEENADGAGDGEIPKENDMLSKGATNLSKASSLPKSKDATTADAGDAKVDGTASTSDSGGSSV